MSARSWDPQDVDAAFEEIVRHIDDEGEDEGRRRITAVNPPFRGTRAPLTWPAEPSPAAAADDDEGVAPPPSPAVPWRTDPTHSVAEALLGGGEDDPDDDFVPGPTAPLPPTSEHTFWAALLGLVVGPVLVLWSVVTGSGGTWWTWLGLALAVGGFVALVLRAPTASDDLDDGARV